MINLNEDDIICNYIVKRCSENPALCRRVIDAATEGVKLFADKQRDFGSKLGFAMTEVVSNTKQDKFGSFSRQD